ncbi:MAG: hypothetical protein ACREQV_03275 [Candidatus Binatia bacterium]
MSRVSFGTTRVPDYYVEWEIVKGDQIYAVQIDPKDNKATKIDVAANMWKAKRLKRR